MNASKQSEQEDRMCVATVNDADPYAIAINLVSTGVSAKLHTTHRGWLVNEWMEFNPLCITRTNEKTGKWPHLKVSELLDRAYLAAVLANAVNGCEIDFESACAVLERKTPNDQRLASQLIEDSPIVRSQFLLNYA